VFTVSLMLKTVEVLSSTDSCEKAHFFFNKNLPPAVSSGFSRDDASKFIPGYMNKGILESDPFITIDTSGVGLFMKMALQNALPVNPDLDVGVCGEHGGDPKSVHFFHDIGVNYVSCSPFRVPIARIAAGQAAIRSNFKNEH